jgi:hypothetical protein
LSACRPPVLANRVHSLVSAVLFEVPSLLLPATPFGEACPAWGFLPSSRHHRQRPLSREHTLSRYVPSSGFCNLSTAYSASGFVGLLHPTATSRVDSVQGFLSTRSRPDSSPGLFLPAVTEPTTHRPRSAATFGWLSFEALLRESQRALRLVVSLPLSRSPLRLSSSSRLWLVTVNPVPRVHPLLTLAWSTFPNRNPKLTALPAYSVLSMTSLVLPSPVHPPARGLLPSGRKALLPARLLLRWGRLLP